MNILKLIRAFINRHSFSPDYRIWQCASFSKGTVGAACQRLRGHAGKCGNGYISWVRK